MNPAPSLHPAIERTIVRHAEFFAGTRAYLVKINMPIQVEEMDAPPAFDGLDWERDFAAYVRGNVANGVGKARARLALGIDDDSIPLYFPYFGISIHHSFFGGAVTFSEGTSYAAPVIERAADWALLHPDAQHAWLQRLAWGLSYARDHGEGVLFASLRGGNGPLDMANGVLGNALFTEIYDDPDNLHRVMDICTRAIVLTFAVQTAQCSTIAGGHFVPMGGLWTPSTIIGHLSLDAACLAGPAAFENFELPYLDMLAQQVDGFVIHTHMLGYRLFPHICRARGMRVFNPANDPNAPALLEVLDEVLSAVRDIPLQLHIPARRLAEILPRFQGRRAIFSLEATDADDALRQLETVNRYCPLER